MGISGILNDILSGSGLVSTMSVSEQIFEIVNLANELLPPLPNVYVKESLLKKSTAGSSSKQEEMSGSRPEISAREKSLSEQPDLLHYGMDLLPQLIQMYGSSVNQPMCHECLSVIWKLMYFSTAAMIQSLLGVTNISR